MTSKWPVKDGQVLFSFLFCLKENEHEFRSGQIRPSMAGVRFHFILTQPQLHVDSACENEAM